MLFDKYSAIFRNLIRGIVNLPEGALHWLLFAAALTSFSAGTLLWTNEEAVVDYARLWNSTPSSVLVDNGKTSGEFPKNSGLPKGGDQYFRLSLQFRASSMNGHPNIFQTSGANDGIRAELDNGVLGVIVGTDQKPQSPASMRISNSIELGRWYNLTIEALNSGFVRVRFEDRDLGSISGRHVRFKTDDFKVGVGFDEERIFRGDISDVNVDVSDVRSFRFGILTYWSLLISSFLIFAASIGLVLIALINALRANFSFFVKSIWRDDIDRRIVIVCLTLAVCDFVAWSYSSLELPRRLAKMLNVHTDTLPSRAPLFELSAPFTDFTEIATFPHYVSAVSWASPPAEQLRIMVKQLASVAWPTLWDRGFFFIVFCGLGLAIHLFGMLRLTQACAPDQARPATRILLLSILLFTLYPIHFAIDRGNAALQNTGLIILGAAWFLRGSPYLAAICFDLATISKITPIAFAIAYFRDHSWKALAVMMVLAAAGFIIPTLVLSHLYGYHIQWMIEGQKVYTEDYAISPKIGLGYSTSLFSLIRLGVVFAEVAKGYGFEEASFKVTPIIRSLLPFYTAIMAVVGLDLFVQTWRRRMTPAIVMCLSAIYQIMAPPILADYYLTLLVLPLLIFICTPSLKHDNLVQIVILAILVPKTFAWIPLGISPAPFAISIGVPVNAALTTFLYLYVRAKYVGRQETIEIRAPTKMYEGAGM